MGSNGLNKIRPIRPWGRYYILEGHEPVEEDMYRFARWFETADRSVARTDIGEIRVSTVFLGLDHQFGDGPPLLFETMIFGGPRDQEQYRYSTWDRAEEGHNRIVAQIRKPYVMYWQTVLDLFADIGSLINRFLGANDVHSKR